MAAYLIAFIAAASHLESVEVAERYGRFRCVAIGGAPPAVDALNLLLPPLHVVVSVLRYDPRCDAPKHGL